MKIRPKCLNRLTFPSERQKLRDGNRNSKVKPERLTLMIGVPQSPPNKFSKVLRKEDGYHVLHKDFWLKNINSIPEGGSFGDVAILGKNLCTRNATIFCQRDCYFAVMDKNSFQRIIGEHQERETMSKVNFLQQVRLFSYFHQEQLKTMIYFLEPLEYSFREKILSQGHEIEHFYIIAEGEVKVRLSYNYLSCRRRYALKKRCHFQPTIQHLVQEQRPIT